MSQPNIPPNMREVTKEQFFAVMGPLDVNPRPGRDFSEWETRDRRVIGRSWPGYLCQGPTAYAIVEAGQ
jgi:hypothetical protein